ncbi:hypothetical protein [Streptomyces sp. SYSU K217416]
MWRTPAPSRAAGRHPPGLAGRLVAAGVAALSCVALGWGPPWLVLPALAVGGAGMGLGMASIGVLALAASTGADRGFNSSPIALLDLALAAVAVLGACITGRRAGSYDQQPAGHS